jgi:4-hydroxybenzoate polyprenyltransferase
MAVRRTAAALIGACHPGPCVAVTLFTAVLAVLAGNGPLRVVTVALAVLAGQLSIGWTNDRIDARRDILAGRSDKPLANGRLAVRTVDRAIAVSMLATAVLSASLGWRFALLHVAAVASGWLYNLRLKSTAASWLPYAFSFGALPVLATLALPHPRTAGGWIVAASACLGVVAHLTNVLPDLAGDLATGIRGFPHRLGAARSLLLSVVLLLVASALLVIGPPGSPSVLRWLGLAAAATLAVLGGGWAVRHPQSRTVFYGLVGFVALQLAFILSGAHRLH